VASDGEQEHGSPVFRTIRTASGAVTARAQGRPAVPNLTIRPSPFTMLQCVQVVLSRGSF
jgi:hypothetical protein